MINVGRDNRTSGSNFITDKFRSDIFPADVRQSSFPDAGGVKTSLRMRSRPIFSRMAMNSISGVMMPLAGVVQLGDTASCFGAFWC